MKIFYQTLLLLPTVTLGRSFSTEELRCTTDDSCFLNGEDMARYYTETGHHFAIDFGEKQQVVGPYWNNTLHVIKKTEEYMESLRSNETMSRQLIQECRCRHELCSFWAAVGECENNPDAMQLQCAPSCQSCHMLDFNYRCPVDKDAPIAWEPGDLNRMFERITTDEYYVTKYRPTILSKPPEGPWIITLENFATKEECEEMIALGYQQGYERSAEVGKKSFDGVFQGAESEARTSTNAWCLDECYENPMHQRLLQVVENITGIPERNSEHWQLLKYEKTQFYALHHDYIPFQVDRPQGPRIFTFFVSLNEVTQGGGTRFPHLGITVEPKPGRALLWPNVLDNFPDRIDARTYHEALPVKEGIKYGANAWIHARDYKTPFKRRCT